MARDNRKSATSQTPYADAADSTAPSAVAQAPAKQDGHCDDADATRLEFMEELTKQLADDAPSAVYVCDAETYELFYVNKQCARMCGKPASEAAGQTCFGYLKGQSKPCEPCYMDLCVDARYTEQVYSSPATGKHYLTHGKFIDWNGRRALVEYMTDETARFNAQKNLNALVDGIPGGIGIFNFYPDNKLELVYLNNGYYTMMDAIRNTHKDYAGFSILDAMHPEERDSFMAELAVVVREGGMGSFDVRIVDGTGRYRWLNIKAKAMTGSGEASTVYVTYTDIDQMKNSQFHLEASHRAMEMASRSAGISFWHFDIDKKRVVAGDTQLTTSMGYQKVKENVPDSLFEDGEVHPADIAECRRMYDEIFADAEGADCTVRLLNYKTGNYLWHHLACTRLHDAVDNARHAIGIAESVQLQHEMKLRYEQELQIKQRIMKDSIFYYEMNLTSGVIEEYYSRLPDVAGLRKDIIIDDDLHEDILSNVEERYRETVRNTLFSKALTEAYERGETTVELVYRRKLADLGFRWVRGAVTLTKRPESEDIVAFLFFHDIDDEKKDQLALDAIVGEEIESTYLINVKRGMGHLLKINSSLGGMSAGQEFRYDDASEDMIWNDVVDDDQPQLEIARSLDNLTTALDEHSPLIFAFRKKDAKGQVLHKRSTAFYLDDTHEDIVLSCSDITEQHETEMRLESIRKNEELLRLVVDHSARVIYHYDIATRKAVSVKSEVSDALGLPSLISDMPESLIAEGIIVSEDAERVREMFRAARKHSASESLRARVRDSAGKILWLDMKFSFINDETGPAAAIISCLDITEQHEREVAYVRYLQTVEANAANNAAFFESDLTADLIEKQGGKLCASKTDAVGRRRSSFVAEALDFYFLEDDRERAERFLSRERLLMLYGNGTRELTEDWQITLSDKTLHWMNCSIQLVVDPYTGHVKAFTSLKDITEEKMSSIEIQTRAETDGLTGLYNKTTTESLIKAQIAKADRGSCALLIADLDDLKHINDAFGHVEGDHAIRLLANMLRTQFRQTDIVGRIGGDEFAAFLGDITEARLLSMLTAFLRKLSAQRIGRNQDIAVCSSIGGVIGTAGIDTYEELFEKADKALYHVKRNGKDDFALFTPDMEKEGYRYEARRTASKWRSGYFDSEELDHLLKAVSTIYPLVISCNLTQNSYYMLQYENFTTRHAMNAGRYDDELIAVGAETFHPDDQESFRQAFDRENLFEAHERGEAKVSHTGRQRGEDGIYRRIRTDAVFVKNGTGDDLLTISLSRDLDAP